MEGGREQNYWPGFVDVLSNVVLTLVFVLVVFVIALSLSANKVEKQMQNIIQEKKKLEQSAAMTRATVTSPSDSIEIDNTDADKAEQAHSTVAVNIVQQSTGKLVIYYPFSGIELDDQSAAKLDDVLGKLKKDPARSKVILHSYLGKEQYSVAQRLAYYRVLYVRKFLIDKGITTSEQISSKIMQNNEITDTKSVGHVEILFSD